MFVYLIWAPFWSNPLLLFLPILGFGFFQATMNLSLLSIYPYLFPTPAARAKALVPQQVMTISGLLLGMTLPAIVSDDWRDPGAFSRMFVMALGAITFACSTLLSRFEKDTTAPGHDEQSNKHATPPQAIGPTPHGQGGKHAAALQGGQTGTEPGILANASFRLLLLNVFLCQVGNALLASTQVRYTFVTRCVLLRPVAPCTHAARVPHQRRLVLLCARI